MRSLNKLNPFKVRTGRVKSRSCKKKFLCSCHFTRPTLIRTFLVFYCERFNFLHRKSASIYVRACLMSAVVKFTTSKEKANWEIKLFSYLKRSYILFLLVTFMTLKFMVHSDFLDIKIIIIKPLVQLEDVIFFSNVLLDT